MEVPPTPAAALNIEASVFIDAAPEDARELLR
jgi:hypothetical protein